MPAKTEAEIAEQVKALFEADGDRGVQQKLQAEIQRTKKCETETASFKKKTEQAKRDNAKLEDQLAKITQSKVMLESRIKQALVGFDTAKEQNEQYVKELEAERDRIKIKTLEEVAAVNGKMFEEEKIADDMIEENKKLEEEFTTKKKELDDLLVGYQEDFKLKATESKLVEEEMSKVHAEKHVLTEQQDVLMKNVTHLAEKKQHLTVQAQLYTEKTKEFAETVEKTKMIIELGKERCAQLEAELKAFGDKKQQYVDIKRQADQDAVKVRQTIAQMKKKIQAAEKAKIAAESKCREAQKKAAAAKA